MQQTTAAKCLSLLHKTSSLKHVQKIHANMIKTAIDQDPYPITKLVEFSALSAHGSFVYARELFVTIQSPSLFLYNTMIRGSVTSGQIEETILLYIRMRGENIHPNNFTFPFVLRACEQKIELRCGEEVHGCILRTGFGSNRFVLTTLLNMYSVCDSMTVATRVFEEMPERDVVSWNSMIAGSIREGCLESARSYFECSPERSVVSWNLMMSGYANSGNIEEVERLFKEMPVKDTVAWNSMIGGFVTAGNMASAKRIFDTMPEKDVVSWTAMIDGYVKNGQFNCALLFFHQMQLAEARPSEVTLLSVLSACAHLGTLDQGRWVHDYINKYNFTINNNLGTALIDMYVKCGDMERASEVFSVIESKDVIAWTAIIIGFAMNGQCNEALDSFSRMLSKGLIPDEVTFLGVLCACSHAGFVEEGNRYFNSMRTDYRLVPRIEHYSCMVDLLGRAGFLEEAEELVKTMPLEPDSVIWGSLFGACQVHNNVELGEQVIKHLLEIEPENKGNYVTLSNIYAAAGRWNDVADVRKKLKEKGIRGIPGCSSIEVNSEVHEFVSGDRSHKRSMEIYEMLDLLAGRLKVAEYVMNCHLLHHENHHEKKRFTDWEYVMSCQLLHCDRLGRRDSQKKESEN